MVGEEKVFFWFSNYCVTIFAESLWNRFPTEKNSHSKLILDHMMNTTTGYKLKTSNYHRICICKQSGLQLSTSRLPRRTHPPNLVIFFSTTQQRENTTTGIHNKKISKPATGFTISRTKSIRTILKGISYSTLFISHNHHGHLTPTPSFPHGAPTHHHRDIPAHRT